MAVTSSTPIELIDTVYERLGERVARAAQPVGAAPDLRREGAAQPPARPRPAGRAGQVLHRPRSRPRGHAGRHGPDGPAAVHDRRPAHGGRARHRALRPPDPGPRGRQGRPAGRAGDQPRGVRLPRVGVGQLRRRLLEAGVGHHPPGRARAVRLPGRDDDRHRQPHPQRRRAGHGGHRRGRRRRRRRDDRLPVQRALAQAHRRPPDRRAQRLVGPQGHHPEGGRGPDRAGRHRGHRRVLRTGRHLDQLHRQGHHLQHGRRDRRHHVDLRLRRRHGPLPEGHRARGGGRRGRRGGRRPAGRRRGAGRSGHVLRPGHRDRPRARSSRSSTVPTPRTGPGRCRRLGAEARAEGWPTEISAALVGSCTNSSYEDITRAASIARQAAAAGLDAARPS